MVFRCVALFEIKTSQIQTVAKSLGDFELVRPLPQEDLLLPAKDDSILPLPVGAVWVPSKPSTINLKPDQLVTLHFHGGAYVMVTPGLSNAQNGPRLLAQETDFPVLMLDYRLACNQGGRHPAALQDAIAGYKHLLDMGFPPSKILISGDSAGGHLALMLLRYIAENSEETGLPTPFAAALWSAWCDMTIDPDHPDAIPNAESDYVSYELVDWGLGCFLPPNTSPDQPYLSPAKYPFETSTRLYFHAGTAEVVHAQVSMAVKNYSAIRGNEVFYEETIDTTHDIFAAGSELGFGREQMMIIRAAMRALRRGTL